MLNIQSLNIPGNIFLAPVSGWTDSVFRGICAEWGAACTFTELVSGESIVRNLSRAEPLLQRSPLETCCGIQLFGSDPQVLYRAASLLARFRPDFIDINAGCPVQKVIKTGAGSVLMRNPALLGSIVEGVRRACEEFLHGIPVTVKIRSGWDDSRLNYVECARAAVESGAAMVTLHPRTRAQAYTGTSNWDHIADLVSRIPVPVTGSGDLFSPEDAQEMFEKTKCAALMFARGALGNPFIFSATQALLNSEPFTPVEDAKKIETGIKQLEELSKIKGESLACREMRKQFCAYTKGMPGSAEIRGKIVHAETIAEYRDIFKHYPSPR
ncbi:tRNA-dihydrouridine synthase [Spirochaetia bacterium]|nr:tRNA-dihydrouridine synthase [Spirochaetia bacterium]